MNYIESDGMGTKVVDTTYLMAENARLKAENEQKQGEGFRAGVKAMFDHLLTRVANHWHGLPELNKQCEYDNNLVSEWAQNALKEVSPEDYTTWVNIHEQHNEIMKLRQQLEIATKSMQEVSANLKKNPKFKESGYGYLESVELDKALSDIENLSK